MLKLVDINKRFPGGLTPVLQHVHLQLQPGDFCMVIGNNGSGKSTLMKIIAGECNPDSGTVQIQQRIIPPGHRSPDIACVIQDVNQGTIPDMTMLENMTLSLSRTQGTRFALYRRRAPSILKTIQALGMGLERYLHLPLSHLSGGQRQMIATVMAVVATPQLLLLDEHTSALDPASQQRVMAYTANAIAKHRLTSLMITHHLGDAIRYGNRLIMLHQGQIVFDVSGDEKARLTIPQLTALFHREHSR